MDIQNQQSNNFSQQIPKKIEYDLEEEKKRIAEGTEEIKKELWEKWKKTYANAEIFPPAVSRLNSNVREVLLSFENTILYNSLTEKFKLNPTQRDLLSQIVWEGALKNNFGELEKSIQDKLGLNSDVAKNIFSEINQKIIQKISTTKNIPLEKPAQKQIVKISLEEALKKIPEIGEQIITSGMLKLSNFPDPVRPSVKNWLADYYFHLGNEAHNSMQRSAYLFQSPNGKMLSSADREKLGFLLKASDERLILDIDPEAKKIIFPPMESFASRPQPMQPIQQTQIPKTTPKKPFPQEERIHIAPEKNLSQPDSNIKKADFSFSQRMPQEKPPVSLKKNFSVSQELPQKQIPPQVKPAEKKPNFSEELKKLREKSGQKNQSQKTVNVINLKDLV